MPCLALRSNLRNGCAGGKADVRVQKLVWNKTHHKFVIHPPPNPSTTMCGMALLTWQWPGIPYFSSIEQLEFITTLPYKSSWKEKMAYFHLGDTWIHLEENERLFMVGRSKSALTSDLWLPWGDLVYGFCFLPLKVIFPSLGMKINM